jgi:hypothetical protein
MTWNNAHFAMGLLWLLAATACTPLQPTPEPAKPGEEPSATPVRDTLPAELKLLQEQGLEIRGDRVTFEDELHFPPKLKGQPPSSSVQLAVTPGPHPSVQEARQRMRAMAVAHPRVKAALGERFSLLRSGWLDGDKDAQLSAATDRYQMVFYNYTQNTVVTVIALRQHEVIDVQSKAARVQPAESREEVDAAIEIVRSDPQYGRLIKDLRGRGIQTESPDKDRYLYLLFYREPRTPAVFEATVNMSAGKVVAARPLR